MTRSKMGDKWQAAASSQEPEEPLHTDPRQFIYSNEPAAAMRSFYEELGRQMQAGLYSGVPIVPMAHRPAADKQDKPKTLDRDSTLARGCYKLSGGNQGSTCPSCASRLIRAGIHVLPRLTGDCYICDLMSGKPEAFTKPFCDFLTENPTIFHAVDYFKEKLNGAGFTEVRHYVESNVSRKQPAYLFFSCLATRARRLVREDHSRRKILRHPQWICHGSIHCW